MSEEDPAPKILNRAKENKMTNRTRNIVSSLIVPALCAVALATPSVAFAGSGQISSTLFHVDAVSGSLTGSADIPLVGGPSASGDYFWNLDAPITVKASDSTVLGVITGLSTYINTDPMVSMSFSVVSGGSATLWTLSSATVNFPAMNASGISSAAMTITDSDGGAATTTGNYLAGVKSFQASTNLGTFSSLVGNLSAGANLSATGSENFPLVGYSPIVGSVSSIQTAFSFTLSANDQASGTGVFAVVPEPGGVLQMATCLTGFAGLLIRRRK